MAPKRSMSAPVVSRKRVAVAEEPWYQVIIFSGAGNAQAKKYASTVLAAKAVFGLRCTVILKMVRETVGDGWWCKCQPCAAKIEYHRKRGLDEEPAYWEAFAYTYEANTSRLSRLRVAGNSNSFHF